MFVESRIQKAAISQRKHITNLRTNESKIPIENLNETCSSFGSQTPETSSVQHRMLSTVEERGR